MGYIFPFILQNVLEDQKNNYFKATCECPKTLYKHSFVCMCFKKYVLLLPAGGTCMGWWMHWAQGMRGLWGDKTGKLEGKGVVWRPAPRASQVYFGEQLKDSWQVTARPPIRLRNSWKPSCPSLFTSSFLTMWSRTPGSFWFFVKAASSLFMKVRNSVLESAELLLSFPAYLQKYHMYFPDTYTHTHF